MPHSGMNHNLVLLNADISKYNSVKDGKLFTDAIISSRSFVGIQFAFYRWGAALFQRRCSRPSYESDVRN